MLAVNIEPAGAEEARQQYSTLLGQIYRQRRRCRQTEDRRKAREERLVNDLEAGATTDQQGLIPSDWQLTRQREMADHLVYGVVSADVLARHQDPPHGVHDRRAVRATRLREQRLCPTERREQLGERG